MTTYPPQLVKMASALAAKFDADKEAMLNVLADTVLPKGSPAEVQAFLIVATQYGLNPITNQIYAFPKKGGGIQPMVGVDGWLKLANDQDAFDGMDFTYQDSEPDDAGNAVPISVTCTVWRSDRSRGHSATEFYEECKRNTPPWKDMPRRMLRHRAMVQALRIAFGFSGIMEKDEAEEWQERERRTQPAGAAQPRGTATVLPRAGLDDLRAESKAAAAPLDADTQAMHDAFSGHEAPAPGKPAEAFPWDGDETTDPEGA